ncbi:AI-2E family transporter [Candidatus Falkowbacteria bacterium]|jgi:predicted PurR-regulated permease PerM|nr:AI-2E family transporter [Candidatus Falkowbacteria bacterium]MBT7007627.1 AI-2E family transporter [Candidatus Falkowbacteria bacterium]
MQKRQLVDLSILSIVKFFLIVLALFFLYMIKEVLAILFISLILASAVDPWVDSMERIKFPRWLSILLIYLVFIFVIVTVVFLIIPPIVQQVGQLSNDFPQYFEKISSFFGNIKNFSAEHGFGGELDDGINAIKANLGGMFSNIFGTVAGIFGGIFSFVIVLVITFYMTVEESAIKRTLTYILPDKLQPFTLQLINKVQRKIGDWLKGQLILSLIIGVMVYIGLMILGVNYALVLALLAAIGEFIPYLGPTLTAIPAIFLAFTQSPIKALFVLILFVIIQQIENNLLVPKVMQKAVGLNPILSITALLIGARVGGVIGMLLAIPVATAISVIVREIWNSKTTLQKSS